MVSVIAGHTISDNALGDVEKGAGQSLSIVLEARESRQDNSTSLGQHRQRQLKDSKGQRVESERCRSKKPGYEKLVALVRNVIHQVGSHHAGAERPQAAGRSG